MSDGTETRPQLERSMGLLEVGQIHRTAAIDDGLEPRMLARAGGRMLSQALDHGGRGEQGDPAPVFTEREDLARIEAAALRDDLTGRLRRVGQDIKAGTV